VQGVIFLGIVGAVVVLILAAGAVWSLVAYGQSLTRHDQLMRGASGQQQRTEELLDRFEALMNRVERLVQQHEERFRA
jgi:hypothetical protein